ncbi:MAG: PAS domain S-box protein, partial [Cyclobacteriaceae bacterium]
MINKENLRFKGFIQITNLVIMALGLIVMLGWVFDITLLKSILPGFSTMKFNTALSFMLIASSIHFQLATRDSLWQALWKLPAAFVLTIGLLSLTEEFLKINLGIDQLFFAGDPLSPTPSRISGATALCFSLMGFFAVTLRSKRSIHQLSQVGLHIVTFISFIAVFGYLLGLFPLYKHWFINSMAIHTSVGFLSISVSASLIFPSLGISNLFTGNRIGNVMARRLFSQMIIAILILAYIRIISMRYEWVTVEFGIALFAFSFILVTLILIRSTANALNNLATKKDLAENSLEQTSTLLDSTPDPIIIIDNSGTILLSNLQTQQVFGYSKEELVGQKVEVLIPERFKGNHVSHRTSFFKAPKTRSMGSGHELFAKRRDGKEVPVEVSLSPIKIGEEIWVSAAIRDVSARRLEEIKLNQLVSIIDSSADAIVSKKTDGTILSWNAAAERILGYTAEEIVGKNVSLIFPPDLYDEEKMLMEQITQGKIVSQHETLRIRKDQKKIHVSITLSPIRDSKGEIWAVSAILRDITEQKQKEAEKRRIEEVLERTNEIARIGAWEVDLINNTVYWSKITKEIHEVPQDFIPDLAGGIEFYKEGKSRDTIQKVVGEAIETGKTFDVELEIVTAKKNIRWVRSIGQSEFEDGKCVRLYGVFQDIDVITKSKEALNIRNLELQAILNSGHVSIIGTDTA